MPVTKNELERTVLTPSQTTLTEAGWSDAMTWETWAEVADKLLIKTRRARKIKDLVSLTNGLSKYLEVMLKAHGTWPADKVEHTGDVHFSIIDSFEVKKDK